MFSFNPCAAGCGRPAITGSALCGVHSANPEADAKRLAEYIITHKVVRDITAQGLQFKELDFSHHQFYGCNFSETSFYKCVFTGAVMRMTFFDFSTLASCGFSAGDLQFLSMAGAVITDCDFKGSELVNINFNGAVITGSVFNQTNLYNSRFVGAGIAQSNFIDCNLKRTNFLKSLRENISYKLSNTAEAIFEMEEYT